MPIGNWNLEWSNLNAERAYPLTADSTRQDITGSFTLPDDLIIGMRIPIHAGNDVVPGNFFVRSVSNYQSGFSVVIGYNAVGGPVNVCSASVARAAFASNQPYSMSGVGDFADTLGWVAFGTLASLDLQPAGQFFFDINGGRLEPDAIQPVIRGLTGLRTLNGNNLSELLTGDIVLQAGANFRLTPVIAAGQDPVIVFDAIEGAGLTQDCICTSSVVVPIKTINGVAGTPDGNFTLLGNSCLQLTPIQYGLQANDICSQPCCGCAELAVLTSALEDFGNQARTLENFLTVLEAQVNQMNLVVLGSRLGDNGCVQCP